MGMGMGVGIGVWLGRRRGGCSGWWTRARAPAPKCTPHMPPLTARAVPPLLHAARHLPPHPIPPHAAPLATTASKGALALLSRQAQAAEPLRAAPSGGGAPRVPSTTCCFCACMGCPEHTSAACCPSCVHTQRAFRRCATLSSGANPYHTHGVKRQSSMGHLSRSSSSECSKPGLWLGSGFGSGVVSTHKLVPTNSMA